MIRFLFIVFILNCVVNTPDHRWWCRDTVLFSDSASSTATHVSYGGQMTWVHFLSRVSSTEGMRKSLAASIQNELHDMGPIKPISLHNRGMSCTATSRPWRHSGVARWSANGKVCMDRKSPSIVSFHIDTIAVDIKNDKIDWTIECNNDFM